MFTFWYMFFAMFPTHFFRNDIKNVGVNRLGISLLHIIIICTFFVVFTNVYHFPYKR